MINGLYIHKDGAHQIFLAEGDDLGPIIRTMAQLLPEMAKIEKERVLSKFSKEELLDAIVEKDSTVIADGETKRL